MVMANLEIEEKINEVLKGQKHDLLDIQRGFHQNKNIALRIILISASS